MNLYIDNDIFNNQDRIVMRQLDTLFSLIEQERHTWRIETESDLDTFAQSYYLDQQPHYLYNTYAEIARKTFDKSIYPSNSTQIHISAENISQKTDWLQETVYLVLENIDSDKYFIDALLRTFGKDKKYCILHKAIAQNWLVLEHAGGKDGVPKILNYHYNRTVPNGYEPRIFILFDSDRLSPKEDYETVKNSIIQRYNKQNTACHILYKREIENYLPDDALANLPEILYNTRNAYTNLSREQKDFYDLEKGFDDKSEPSNENQKSLYANILNTDTYKHLRKGFHRKGKEGSFNTKNEMPKLFDNEYAVTKQTLISICKQQPNPNELHDILNSILSLL